MEHKRCKNHEFLMILYRPSYSKNNDKASLALHIYAEVSVSVHIYPDKFQLSDFEKNSSSQHSDIFAVF